MDPQARLDAALAESGWVLVRQTGHSVYRCQCGSHTLTVPVTGSDWRGPLNSLANLNRLRDECEGRQRPAAVEGQRRTKPRQPSPRRREAEQRQRERAAIAERRHREEARAAAVQLREQQAEAERATAAQRAARVDEWRREIEALMRPGRRR